MCWYLVLPEKNSSAQWVGITLVSILLLVALGNGVSLVMYRGVCCISVAGVAPWGMRVWLHTELLSVHACV